MHVHFSILEAYVHLCDIVLLDCIITKEIGCHSQFCAPLIQILHTGGLEAEERKENT